MPDMTDALREFYHDQKICVDHFGCPHAPECSAETDDFTEAREASVGSKYVSGDVPRLLFVSLDPGSGDENRKISLWDGPRDLDPGRKIMHWYQTHSLASEIISVYGPELPPEETPPYFAHISVVRCSENRDHDRRACAVLYDNCPLYLRPEMEILAPDYVISQGKKAREAIEESFDDEEVREASHLGLKYSVLSMRDDKQAVWFSMHHPHYPGYWSQKSELLPAMKNVVWHSFESLQQMEKDVA